ncbi:hypothetical protein [Streptomyces sp. S186]|uniref:hypothetical protein n=1 Tax=Streptomyces sp. S186 TaxID=3434395 RepID=UPI003F677425
MPLHPESAGQPIGPFTSGFEVSMTCVTGRQTQNPVDIRVSPTIAPFIAVIFLGIILVYGPAAAAPAAALSVPLGAASGLFSRLFYLRVRAARLR